MKEEDSDAIFLRKVKMEKPIKFIGLIILKVKVVISEARKNTLEKFEENIIDKFENVIKEYHGSELFGEIYREDYNQILAIKNKYKK